jgi:hypothetical protein
LVGLAPILIGLFLRNIALFNEAFPYRINQGYFATPIVSLRVLIEAVLLDLSGSRTISKLAWDFLPLISITLPIFLSAIYFTCKQWRTYNLKEKFFILFSCFLLISSSGMLVIAHTYHGLDPGDLIRHVFPFSWTLYPLLLITFRLNRHDFGKILFGAIGAIIIFAHLSFIRHDIQKTQEILSILDQSPDITLAAQPLTEKYKILTNEINFKISKDRDILDVVASLPSDAFLISNVGGSLRRLSGRPVRTVEFNARNLQKTLMDIVEMAETITTARDFFLIVLPSNDIARSADNIHWQEKTTETLIPHGFSVVAERTNIIVFSKPRKH